LIGEMTFTALLELVNSSSTQVPLFMPRHLQTWYSLEDCFVCRHPDGCAMSVADVLSLQRRYEKFLLKEKHLWP
jgi:hypothetical protein